MKRKTTVRVFFRPVSSRFPEGGLDAVWVSSLSRVYDSEIGSKLYSLRNSFSIIK